MKHFTKDIVKRRALVDALLLSPSLLPFFAIRLIPIGLTGAFGFNLLGLIPFEFFLAFGFTWGALLKDPTQHGRDYLPKTFLWTLGITPLLMTLFFTVCYLENASSLTSLEETLGTALATIPALSTLGFVGLGILGLPFAIGNGLVALVGNHLFRQRYKMELAIAGINESHRKLVKSAQKEAKGAIRSAFIAMEEKRKSFFERIGPNPARRQGEAYLALVGCERAVLQFWRYCEKVFSPTELTYQRQTQAALHLFDAIHDASLELLEASGSGDESRRQTLQIKIVQATGALQSLSSEVSKLKAPQGTLEILDVVHDELNAQARLVEKFKKMDQDTSNE